jgi:hypothetical protein
MIGFEAAIIEEFSKIWIEDDLFWSNGTNGVQIRLIKALYIIR